MSITGDHCVKQGKPDTERQISRNLGPLEDQKIRLTAGSASAALLAGWLAGLSVCFMYLFLRWDVNYIVLVDLEHAM